MQRGGAKQPSLQEEYQHDDDKFRWDNAALLHSAAQREKFRMNKRSMREKKEKNADNNS